MLKKKFKLKKIFYKKKKSNKKRFSFVSLNKIEILDYDKDTLYESNILNTINIIKKKIISNQKNMAYISMTLLVIIILSISANTTNIKTSFKKCLNGLGIYTEEVKSIELQSISYNNPGSWHIEKSARWTSKNSIEIEIDLDSVLLGNENDKDVILVLDTSNSMKGKKINQLKDDTKLLVHYLLSNSNNKVGIISFNTNANILSNLTKNESLLITQIDNILPYGSTNYYEALTKVDEILETYTKLEDKDLIVLFLTDGYPDLGNPNQISFYNYLKQKYPYIKVNGVQYEMGKTVADEISAITDKQWVARTTSLGNILYAASEATELFQYFIINDVIDTDYFYINSSNDIETSLGEATIINNNDIKIDFGEGYLTTGSSAKVTIKAYLKNNYVDEEGFYPTNKSTSVQYKIGNEEQTINTTDTPVLGNKFTVSYDSNMPSGCTNVSYPNEEYYIYDIVNKRTNELSCTGYSFGGWQIAATGVDMVNSDTFIMPAKDITIRAEWKKVKITKKIDGTIHTKVTLYKKIENDYNNGATDINLYNGNGSSNYENNVYYYYGATDNNNVLFANKCWKIIRTTDTGGVKLLYNGTYSSENGCNGTSPSIGTGYNSKTTSPGYVGYMYNSDTALKYSYKQIKLSEVYDILEVIYTNSTDDYYYGDSITYDGTNYILGGNVFNGEWKDIYNSTKGKYVCRNGNSTCTEVYYVADIDVCDANSTGSNQYLLKMTSGQLLVDVNKTMYFSSTVNGNNLVNPTSLLITDWVNDYGNFTGYYSCSNIFTNTCTENYYLLSTTRYNFTYINTSHDYVYGNSFTYNNGNYTLTTTKHFWDWPTNYNGLNNNHYTCFNTTGVCDTLYYIIITANNNNDYDALYIELQSGKSISDALDEMLFDTNVNRDNSTAKSKVDNWYVTNIQNAGFSSYLEDTIYCNDRRIDTIGNWSPNNSNTINGLYFATYKNRLNAADLTCYNVRDQFTVSNKNGNGDLTYPVGLITQPEVYLASNQNQSNSFIKSSVTYFTMSPSNFYINNQSAISVNTSGTYNTTALLWYGFGIRPVVSLKEDIEYTSGNGSVMTPYQVKDR